MNKRFLFLLLLAHAACLNMGIAWGASKQATAITSASVPGILQLSLSQNTQSELRFGNISSSILGPTLSTPQSIQIEVTSNTGVKYILTHTASGPLDNGQGQSIPLADLQFRTVAANGTGTAVPSFTATIPSAQTVFSSNEQGTSETVSAEYQLTVPPAQAPGDYSAFITYTVSSV